MPYVCPLCEKMPSSHSLIKLFEKKGIIYYYTCPSQAILYYDANSIINHYDGVFSEIPKNKEWIWLCDGLDFDFKHAMQLNVAIELVKLISVKFNKNLKKIIVINPSFYIMLVHKLIIPFLDNKIKDIIEINYDSKCVEDLNL
jgi:hypothetical protein